MALASPEAFSGLVGDRLFWVPCREAEALCSAVPQVRHPALDRLRCLAAETGDVEGIDGVREGTAGWDINMSHAETLTDCLASRQCPLRSTLRGAAHAVDFTMSVDDGRSRPRLVATRDTPSSHRLIGIQRRRSEHSRKRAVTECSRTMPQALGDLPTDAGQAGQCPPWWTACWGGHWRLFGGADRASPLSSTPPAVRSAPRSPARRC